VRVTSPQKIPLLKNLPLPYPPCQISDLAGNPGTPSLRGREKKIEKTPSVKTFGFPTTDFRHDGERNSFRE